MLSSGEDYEIHEEFLEKPLLKRIEISESGEPGTWNVINFTGERGVFHYEGQVAETTGRKHMYIRAAFADGVTGKIEAKYILGGYTTETSLSLESGSTYAGEMSQFFWVANDRNGDKTITVTATGGRRTRADLHRRGLYGAVDPPRRRDLRRPDADARHGKRQAELHR